MWYHCSVVFVSFTFGKCNKFLPCQFRRATKCSGNSVMWFFLPTHYVHVSLDGHLFIRILKTGCLFYSSFMQTHGFVCLCMLDAYAKPLCNYGDFRMNATMSDSAKLVKLPRWLVPQWLAGHYFEIPGRQQPEHTSLLPNSRLST